MDQSMPGFPDLHYLPETAETHVHWVADAIQPSLKDTFFKKIGKDVIFSNPSSLEGYDCPHCKVLSVPQRVPRSYSPLSL